MTIDPHTFIKLIELIGFKKTMPQPLPYSTVYKLVWDKPIWHQDSLILLIILRVILHIS